MIFITLLLYTSQISIKFIQCSAFLIPLQSESSHFGSHIFSLLELSWKTLDSFSKCSSEELFLWIAIIVFYEKMERKSHHYFQCSKLILLFKIYFMWKTSVMMTETGIVECPNVNKTRWWTSKISSSFYRLRSATEALLSWQWKNNFQMIFILTFASLLFNSLKKKEKKNILCIIIHKDSAHICSKHPQDYVMNFHSVNVI